MAEGSYHFPLKLWEQTEDYARKKKEAEERFKVLDDQAHTLHVGGHGDEVTFTKNLVPAVWRNCSPRYWIHPRSAARALEMAREYGATDFFSAEELEEYHKGEGVVIEMAMGSLGYRRSKRNSKKWALETKKDGADLTPLRKDHVQKLYGISSVTPSSRERERLMDLRAHPNDRMVLNETYSLSVGSDGIIPGMVYLSKDVNPFASSNSEMYRLAIDSRQKAHINKEQDGFTIAARNLRLGRDSGDLRPDGVHIIAHQEGNLLMETVWPVVVNPNVLFDMAVDFRDQAIAQSAPRK